MLLLAATLAAQTDSPAPPPDPLPEPSTSVQSESSAPAATPQTVVPAPLSTAAGAPVPAGTALIVRLDTTLATFSNRAGDPFQGKISQPVVVNGQTLIPAGAMVEGRITKVTEPRRISGKPTIGILPEAVIMPNG